jgi:hypothetical protein
VVGHTLVVPAADDGTCRRSHVESSATALKFTEGCCRAGDKLVKAAFSRIDLAKRPPVMTPMGRSGSVPDIDLSCTSSRRNEQRADAQLRHLFP